MPLPSSIRKILTHPALHIVLAILLGVWFGMAAPGPAQQLRPVGEAFVTVLRFLMLPVMCCAVVHSVASLRTLVDPGVVSLKALLCFEAVSSLALLVGMTVGVLLHFGDGLALPLAASAQPQHGGVRILYLFAAAVATGALLGASGAPGRRVTGWIGAAANRGFTLVRRIVRIAPLIAFAAMANTVGSHGLAGLAPAMDLLLAIYLGTALFVALVLGALAHITGFSIVRFVGAIADALMIAVGTSSSLAAMPRLITTLNEAGCAPELSRVLVPAGYAFNLSGSAVYLGVALPFLAQVAHLQLGVGEYAAMFAVALLCSKTATPVNGSAFMTVTSAMAMLPALPPDGLVLLFSIERLMKCRSAGNLVSVGVTCLAIAAWTGKLDRKRMRERLG